MGDSWSWAAFMYADELYDDEQRREQQEDEMGCDDFYLDEQARAEYRAHKLAEKGYPGVTSQQDIIYEKGGNPGAGMYRPHAYSPGPLGKIGACIECGMGRDHAVHTQIGTTSDNAKGSPMKNPYLEVEVYSPNTVNYRIENIPNDQAMRIVSEVLPKVVDLWLNKSKDYGGNVMQLMKLGPRACIPDMLRKFGKLKRAIWDGQEMVGEQPEEILMDLVGHVLIILDEMSNDDNS